MPLTIDQLDEAHARAALDILEADASGQPWSIYEGRVPDTKTATYVLVYTAVQWPNQGEGQTLEFVTSGCVVRWYVHCVGPTEQAVRALSNRVRQLLVNVRPTITGRTVALIQQEDASQPAVRDETTSTLTGEAVFDLASVYALWTFAG